MSRTTIWKYIGIGVLIGILPVSVWAQEGAVGENAGAVLGNAAAISAEEPPVPTDETTIVPTATPVVKPLGKPDLPLAPLGSTLPIVTNTDASLATFLNHYIPGIISFLIGLIAIIAVFMVIWGGYQFLTAQGEMDKITTGIKTIQWATTGLTIALLSYIIVQIVVNIRLVPA